MRERFLLIFLSRFFHPVIYVHQQQPFSLEYDGAALVQHPAVVIQFHQGSVRLRSQLYQGKQSCLVCMLKEYRL